MKLKRCILALVAVLSGFALTTFALAGSDAYSYVAKIGSTEYTSFDDAVNAANQMTGEVTVEIYGKVEYTSTTANLTGAYDKISFVGKTDDAEISITRDGSNGYISGGGNDCAVSFSQLKLSKPSGTFANDAGYMNVAFTIYRVGSASYDECTFPNGACAAGCPTTYTTCTFQKSNVKYALWAYGANVTVAESTFDCDRGIKMYAEGAAKTTELTVTGCDFRKVTDKPAIVLTYGKSVTLQGNTYSSTGVFELDHEGDPNGTVVTSDKSLAGLCTNDENDCGVLMDGKIYRQVSEAAAVASAGSTITLLNNSSETVQLPAGVTLNTNGFTAVGVTEAAPTEVANFEGLVAALANGGAIKLTADITTTEAIVTTGITSVVDLNGKTLTIGAGDNKFNDASNIIIKNGTISITGLTVNGNAVFCLDEYEEALVTTLTLEEVNLVGDGYSSAYGVFYIGPSSVLNVNGGEWNLKNDTHAAGGVFKADASAATLNIDGLTLTGHNVRRGVTYATTTIKNSTITFSGDADGVDAEMEHGFNRSPLSISNSTITMTDMVGRGITAEKGAVSISDNSTVTMTNCQEATIDVREGQTVTISDNSTVTLDAEPTITSGSINGTIKLPAVAKIGDTEYPTLEAAFTAAQNGNEVEILKAGTYSLATSGKDITITGKVDGVVFDNIGAKDMNGANVTFNNVTFDYYPNGDYTGLQHSGNLVYYNCIFNGQVFLYGASEKFNKCTFNQTSSDAYNVWTYEGKTVVFNECELYSAGKSVLIYSDQSGQTNDVSFVKTKLYATQSVEGKAAIEMDSSIQGYINLTIDDETTATGFDEGSISGNSLWNNMMGNSTEANNDITVTVGDEVVLKPVVLSLSGEGTEASPYLINNLEELVWFQTKVDEQATDGSTQFAGKYFKLTADIDLSGINWNPIGSMIGDHGSFKGVFDGDGHTISNLKVEQAGQGLGLFARTADNAVIKNLNIVNATIKSTNNSNYLGVVVANAFASTKIENVHVSGDILVSGRGYIGGIAGHGYVVMDDVSVKGNKGSLITSTFWCAGGVLGYGGEGTTNITKAHVEGLTITSAAGGLGAIVGMAEDNKGTQPISGSDLSAKDVEIKTYVGDYGTNYEDYALGYLYGGNPTSQLTGTLSVENVTITNASGNAPAEVADAVASVNGKIYFSMADAIAAIGEGDVTIELLRDATLDYNARDAYGVAETTSVTINGNGHTLTLNQKDSDWASIGLAGGKLVLNNMIIEKTGYGDTTGAWNTHAFIFSTEVEMNNVIVNNSVAVEGGAVLNNVVINEAGGYYGLWIAGNGQTVTVNGGSITATNGGRGIKVADEYVGDSEVQLITLNVTGTTFTTAKKAAVLVSSTAGANITASNVNIEAVTEDPVNFVWVDEDWAESYSAVTVTGGTKAQENASKFVASVADAQGNVLAYYPTLDEALAVAQANAGSTLILQSDLTIAEPINVTADLTIDGNGKTLTYTGTDRAITVDSETNGADLTLKNLTVDCTASYCQRGVNYNTNGTLTLAGVTVKGTNVTYALNLPGSSDAATVVINNSSLTGNIALNVWGENANITATDSHFTSVDDTDAENYCAIALNNDGTTTAEGTTITINGGSITALDENEELSTAVRNSTTTGKVNISETTVVKGNINEPVAVVAYEGSTNSYSCFTLQSAINRAASDATATVKLLKDVTVDEMLTVNGAVVIDLNGKTVTANCQKAFEIYADATIKNGTIKSQERCIDTRKNVALTMADLNLVAETYVSANQQPLTIGGADHGTIVTMNKVNINAGTTGYGIISFVKSTLTATDCNISGYASLYVKDGSEGSVFTFNNCALEGHNESEEPSNSFAAVVLEESDVTVNVNGGSVKATGNLMWAVAFGNEATGEVSGNKVTLSNGATISATNADNLVSAYGAGNTAVLPVKPATLPEGYAALPNLDGNYVVGDAPTATVNDLGAKVIEGGEYTVWPSGSNTEDMPLSFVMQFLADQKAEDMETSPYADWYADYVLTFEGLENGSFTADGCYLSGYYGSFGWYKIPVDGTKIEEGVRYPVMLGVGMGQKYDYICSGVQDFLCALYLTPEVLAANPNIQVKLELSLVDNSQGSDAATNALVNNSNIYPVCVTTYNADDFAGPVAKIGDTEYKNLQVAIDAAKSGETITLLRDATLREGLTVASDDEITLDLAGYSVSQEKECTASYQMIQNNGSLTITGEGKISFKDTSAGDPNFGWGSYTINNKGTLVVENGTIEHLGGQTFGAHMIAAIQQSAGATTIKGGTISTPNYRSVRVNSGSLTISGGEFDGQVWLQPNQGDVTLTLTGGTFGPNGEDGSSIFMENVRESYTVSEASISGGTFTTKIGCADASKLAGTITGGRFSEVAVSGTNKALIMAGYEYATEADGEGYYEVKWTGNVDELVIVDGELTEFVNEQELTVGTLTYKRTLASNSYNALYVPFEIPVSMLTDKYDVFYIYDVRSYDNDEDGTPEDWDMEVFKFNKGTLKANYPYFIRPKSADNLDMELTLTDATLYEAEENSVVCSSVFMTYEVKGLYHKVESGELNGCYGISTMGRWIPIGDNILNPFRFYLKMTTIDGAPVNVSEEALSSMRIRVIGEGGTTDIEHLKQNSNRSEEVYDLQGRRVLNPTKGFYIVNGKKVYIK